MALCSTLLPGSIPAVSFGAVEAYALERNSGDGLWDSLAEELSGVQTAGSAGDDAESGMLSGISAGVTEAASEAANEGTIEGLLEDIVQWNASVSGTQDEVSDPEAAQTGMAGAEASEADTVQADGTGPQTAQTQAAQTDAAGDSSTGARSATVMIYMNGSDLETKTGAATADIAEILRAGCGEKVNVVIETLGTKKWHGYDISADTAQRWHVNGSELELVQDDLGQLDATDDDTLSDFIGWSAASYPAERYILLLWDHGGGAVYGYGYDEWQGMEGALTLDEIQKALKEHQNIHFDFIGMDACLMSSLEVCLVLAPYCSYSILSEDFESNIGWYYTDWLKSLEEDPGIDSVELGKEIVDTMLAANKADQLDGGDATLAVINEKYVESLFEAWINFAYANEELLLGNNYSTMRRSKGRVLPALAQASASKKRQGGYEGGYSYDEEDPDVSEYYVTDIMAVAENASGEGTAELETAVSNTISYMASSSSDVLTGIGVTLPYGDSVFYNELKKIFSNCALDSEYIEWLKNFVSAQGSGSFYDYGSWYQEWDGWSGWYAQLTGGGQGSSCDEGSCDTGGSYDNGGSYDDGGDGAWYDESCPDLLYNCYGDECESYDTWYDGWYNEWEDCGSCY